MLSRRVRVVLVVMLNCLYCGTPDAYIGIHMDVRCVNSSCKAYDAAWAEEVKVRTSETEAEEVPETQNFYAYLMGGREERKKTG